jgi:hypothetical protein
MIDNRIETVVKRDNDDIVRITHSKMIKENKCTEFRNIVKCQTGAGSYDELHFLRFEYLPTKYHEDEGRVLQCICSQHISKVHYIREINSNETFRCGADCLKHLDDDLYKRAKQYERQYKKILSEYNLMLNQYRDFLLDYVVIKKDNMTIRELIKKSRFESSTRTIIWLMDNYNGSYPEIKLFVEYLYETETEDVNIEQFLLSMKMPDYKKCDCGYYTKAYHTKALYSEKHNRTFIGCGNSKKTPTGWENGCKFFKFGFLGTKEFGENPLLILAEQVAINNKRLKRVCSGIEYLPEQP